MSRRENSTTIGERQGRGGGGGQRQEVIVVLLNTCREKPGFGASEDAEDEEAPAAAFRFERRLRHDDKLLVVVPKAGRRGKRLRGLSFARRCFTTFCARW